MQNICTISVVVTITLPDQIARTRCFSAGVPGQFTIARNGSTVLFLRSRAGDDPAACLWALDLDSGTERLLAGPADKDGQYEQGGRVAGVDAYAADASGELIACAGAGDLWGVDVADGRARRLPAEGAVADPRPDPTGRRIAYVSGGTALRVIEADGTGDRALAAPAGPDVTFGIAEHTGATSPDGARGYWWSPDGDRCS